MSARPQQMSDAPIFQDLPGLCKQYGYDNSDEPVGDLTTRFSIDFGVSLPSSFHLPVSEASRNDHRTLKKRSLARSFIKDSSRSKNKSRLSQKFHLPTSASRRRSTTISSFDRDSSLPTPDLLGLPRELRDHIYNYIFQDACIHFRPSARGNRHCAISFDIHTACRRTCKKMYLETEDRFFDNLLVVLGRPMHTNAMFNKLPKLFLDKVRTIRVLAGRLEGLLFPIHLTFVRRLPALVKMTFVLVHNESEPKSLLADFPATKEPLFKWLTEAVNLRIGNGAPKALRHFAALEECWEEHDSRFRLSYQEEIGIGDLGRGWLARRDREGAPYLGNVYLFEYEFDSPKTVQSHWLSADEYERRNKVFLTRPPNHERDCECRKIPPVDFENTESRLSFMKYNERMARLQKATDVSQESSS